MESVYYGYEDFLGDIVQVSKKVPKPEGIIAITRGGWMPALFLAQQWELSELHAFFVSRYQGQEATGEIKSGAVPDVRALKNCLVVDEIVDGGQSLQTALITLRTAYPGTIFTSASLFYKKTAILEPDFWVHEATRWVRFFWEVDGKDKYDSDAG